MHYVWLNGVPVTPFIVSYSDRFLKMVVTVRKLSGKLRCFKDAMFEHWQPKHFRAVLFWLLHSTIVFDDMIGHPDFGKETPLCHFPRSSKWHQPFCGNELGTRLLHSWLAEWLTLYLAVLAVSVSCCLCHLVSS